MTTIIITITKWYLLHSTEGKGYNPRHMSSQVHHPHQAGFVFAHQISTKNKSTKKTWVSKGKEQKNLTKPTTFRISPLPYQLFFVLINVVAYINTCEPASFVFLEIWDSTPSPRVLASCSRNPRWSNPDAANVSPMSNDQFSITWGPLPGPPTVEFVKFFFPFITMNSLSFHWHRGWGIPPKHKWHSIEILVG